MTRDQVIPEKVHSHLQFNFITRNSIDTFANKMNKFSIISHYFQYKAVC